MPEESSINKSGFKDRLSLITAIIIILCAVLLGVETYFHSDPVALSWFNLLDIVIIAFFSFEIVYRLIYNEFKLTELPGALRRKVFKVSKAETVAHPKDGELIEEWFWLIFDLLLVILGYLSFLRHYFDHPQTILILRMFRVFRILRVFEFNRALRRIERKIFSVIPTVVTFIVLIFLIIYVYAIIGMHLYDYQQFEYIDFTNLHTSISSMFDIMANGWTDALVELKTSESAPVYLTEIFIYSFFIFSVLITLNVFIAVMTSQIQEKIERELQLIKKKEDQIIQQETESSENQDMLNQKLDKIMAELEEIKKRSSNN